MSFNPSGKTEENQPVAQLDARHPVTVEAEEFNITKLFQKWFHVERCDVEILILVNGVDWLKRYDRMAKAKAHLQFRILATERLKAIPNVVAREQQFPCACIYQYETAMIRNVVGST